MVGVGSQEESPMYKRTFGARRIRRELESGAVSVLSEVRDSMYALRTPALLLKA